MNTEKQNDYREKRFNLDYELNQTVWIRTEWIVIVEFWINDFRLKRFKPPNDLSH